MLFTDRASAAAVRASWPSPSLPAGARVINSGAAFIWSVVAWNGLTSLTSEPFGNALATSPEVLSVTDRSATFRTSTRATALPSGRPGNRR